MSIHTCTACNQKFDRITRLFAHIPKDKDCALHTANILLLTDNGQRGILLDIHTQYFEYTSRKYDENAFRKVRKILLAVYATEEKRLRDIQDAETAAQDALKTAQESEMAKTREYIQGLEADAQDMKDIIASQRQELIELERQRNRARKCEAELKEATAKEPKMGDLLRRLYAYTNKGYKYKLQADHLAPWYMPPCSCVSEGEFADIHKKYIDKPDDLITEFTYKMFANANENQLIYVQNERDQKLYILTRPDDADIHIDYTETIVSPALLDTIVQHVLREIREHLGRIQARIVYNWDPHMRADQLVNYRIPLRKYTPDNEKRLEKDKIIMFKCDKMFTYCKQDFITEHKRDGTKVEAAEIRKTLRTSNQAVAYVVKGLYRLNRAHEVKQRAVDEELIAYHV